MTLNDDDHHLGISEETLSSNKDQEIEEEQELDALLSDLQRETASSNSNNNNTTTSQPPPTPSPSTTSTTYVTLTHEKSLIDILTSPTNPLIIHFHLPTFSNCQTMDMHLTHLATKHREHSAARFLRINVEDAPFLVQRFRVRVLPCVLGFREGKCVERIVGFDGLVKVRRDLERRLVKTGLLSDVLEEGDCSEEDEEEEEGRKERRGIREGRGKRRGRGEDEEDEDSDWD